jgi:hypothetical protein
MKPFKHVTVVKVYHKRKFCTEGGLHMKDLGKEKITLKIAVVVTTSKPFKHVTVVKVYHKRIFCTERGLHMKDLGKEKIALKIAVVVTTSLQNQREEPVSLHWKTEYNDEVSYS